MTTDDELRDVVETLGTPMAVVGRGDLGTAAVEHLAAEGVDGVRPAASPDAPLLEAADAAALDGGTGGGAAAAPVLSADGPASRSDGVADVVFVVTGLDGGTDGRDPAAVVRAAREAGALAVAVVALSAPAGTQGRRRRAFDRVREAADTTVVIRADRDDAPAAADVLYNAVTGIADPVTESGLVNLDLADVRAVIDGGDLAVVGYGRADSPSKAAAAVRNALCSPGLDADYGNATSVLVNVTGGPEMRLDEAGGVIREVHDRIAAARIIWGASIDESLAGTLRTQLVITGVELPWLDAESAPDGGPAGGTAADAGGACPRCGGRLSAYSFGSRQAVACDGCGYADVATDLGG